MAAEKKPRKPAVKGKKYLFKVIEARKETLIRAREVQFYEHSYTPLMDTITYRLYTPYRVPIVNEAGIFDGAIDLTFIGMRHKAKFLEAEEYAPELFRAFVESIYPDIADVVAEKVFTIIEADKTTVLGAKETEIINIKDEYIDKIEDIIRRMP